MPLNVNNVVTVDFFVNSTPVERGYLNGYLFWERKLDLWLSSFLPPGQSTWYGYFDIDAQVQARAPGFKGDLIFHVDCPVVSTNVEYPIDAGPSAPYRGYRSFTIRVEPNGRIYGYGGYGGAGAVGTHNGGGNYPGYNWGPSDGWVHWEQVGRGGLGGGKGGDGGGCINGRGVAVIVIPNAWRNYLMAGGGGGGGGARLSSGHRAAGGGGGIGFNNAPGGTGNAVFPGEAANSGTFGKGGRGDEGPWNYGGPDPQPQIAGYGGLSVWWGENGWAPGNGGNGGTWNQSGGGGAMSLQLWTNWSHAHHFKGRDGNVAPDPQTRGYSAAPGSRGSSHDYRRPWVDGGWGGHSGQPVISPRALYYY